MMPKQHYKQSHYKHDKYHTVNKRKPMNLSLCRKKEEARLYLFVHLLYSQVASTCRKGCAQVNRLSGDYPAVTIAITVS